jgi:hypothetical protein
MLAVPAQGRRDRPGMARQALTVVFWRKPVRRLAGGRWVSTKDTAPAKVHVSIGGTETVCSRPVPQDATVVAVTPDWHVHANCYNCVYPLWADHAPDGYIRPANGADFPLRRECPHAPGRGLNPLYCARCTPVQVRAARDPNWPCPNGCTEPHELARRYTRCTVFPPLHPVADGQRCPPGQCESVERAIRRANPKLFFDLADSAMSCCYHWQESVCVSCQTAPVDDTVAICCACAAAG